uniref:Transmembrane protein 97 n=1 Tax=Phasianus colchicus TaxID=9054 RepID=A0A669PCH6_PHACC
MARALRCLEAAFALYFVSHVPITLLLDLQALLPAGLHPQQVRLLHWYATAFRDPLMLHPPEWFKAFVYCEAFLQLPFFPVAAYAFLKGWYERRVRTRPVQRFCTARSVQRWFIYQP